jgi:hypothetical protein
MAKQTETFEQINTRVLATVTVNKGAVQWFAPILKAWQKPFGSKPTEAMLTAAVLLTSKYASPGIECLHIAMCLRPEGCTVLQYTNAGIAGLGRVVGPANNKRKALVAGRVFNVNVEGKPYAFKLAFTGLGEKALAAAQAGAVVAEATAKPEKPAKAVAKAKGKAKQPKATPVAPAETPTTEAPSPAEGQVAEAVELGGIDPGFDQPSQSELEALAAHFNQS